MDDSQIRGDSVEASASIALNKGEPPSYGRPALTAQPCYLCGLNYHNRINWRGHFICQECFAKESVSETVHPKLVGSAGEPGPARPPDRDVTGKLLDYASAHGILYQAISTISQRGKDYNKPGGERSMKATVEAFNAITGHTLTVVEGWKFMEVLKMVRAQHSPHKIDNFLDGAAYAALAGEEALNK